MISQESHNEYWLSLLEEHLKQERYCLQATRRCTAAARRFLAYLNKRHIAVETTQESNVGLYLQNELRLFRRHRQRDPDSMVGWRTSHSNGIHMLLRLVQGGWPPTPVPSSPRHVFHQQLCQEQHLLLYRKISIVLSVIHNCLKFLSATRFFSCSPHGPYFYALPSQGSR